MAQHARLKIDAGLQVYFCDPQSPWQRATRTTNVAGTGAINLTGNELANRLIGNAGANTLTGGAGIDQLFGNGGNDFLWGGLGNDTLTGGAGLDNYIFDTALTANIDRITDYSVADDTIRIDNAVFAGLTTPAGSFLSAAEFQVGAAAVDADDHIIYNNVTGALIHDSNGNLAGGATQFAILPAGLALTSADFLVF